MKITKYFVILRLTPAAHDHNTGDRVASLRSFTKGTTPLAPLN